MIVTTRGLGLWRQIGCHASSLCSFGSRRSFPLFRELPHPTGVADAGLLAAGSLQVGVGERCDGRDDQLLEMLEFRVLLGVPLHVGDLAPAAGFDGQGGAENGAGVHLADVDQRGEGSLDQRIAKPLPDGGTQALLAFAIRRPVFLPVERVVAELLSVQIEPGDDAIHIVAGNGDLVVAHFPLE